MTFGSSHLLIKGQEKRDSISKRLHFCHDSDAQGNKGKNKNRQTKGALKSERQNQKKGNPPSLRALQVHFPQGWSSP